MLSLNFAIFLNLRRLSVSDAELPGVLRQARAEYLAGDNRLYLCAAQPCCDQVRFDNSEITLETASREAGLTISKTGCQGPCKQAPILSLRIGERNQMFAEVATEKDWRAVLFAAWDAMS